MFGSLKLQYLLWFWLLHFAKPLLLFLALLLTAVAILWQTRHKQKQVNMGLTRKVSFF